VLGDPPLGHRAQTNGGVAWQDVTPRAVSLARTTVTTTYFPSAQTAWLALLDRAVPNPTVTTDAVTIGQAGVGQQTTDSFVTMA
jgi:hypothetical protein